MLVPTRKPAPECLMAPLIPMWLIAMQSATRSLLAQKAYALHSHCHPMAHKRKSPDRPGTLFAMDYARRT